MSTRSISGFSIITLVAVATIMSILLVGFLRFFSSVSKQTQNVSASVMRDSIAQNLKINLRSGFSLNKTFGLTPNTKAYYHCLSDTESASDCSDGTTSEFSLFDGRGVKIAGTNSSPVYYSRDGSQCGTPSPTCPFEATTKFTPLCASGTNCVRAAQLNLEYSVRHHPAGVDPKRGLAQLRLVSGSVTADTQTILNGGAIAISPTDCPPGQYVSGLNSDGTVKCTSLPTPTGTCPAGQYLRGIAADSSLICAQLPTGGCPANHFVSGINNGNPVCTLLPNCVLSMAISSQAIRSHDPPCESGFNVPAFHLVANCHMGTCFGNQKLCYKRLY